MSHPEHFPGGGPHGHLLNEGILRSYLMLKLFNLGFVAEQLLLQHANLLIPLMNDLIH